MARKVDKLGNPIPYMRGKVIWEHIYEIELYEVSETAQFDIVFNLVKILFNDIEFVYIKHDKDTFEDGKPKKPHYHLLLVFPRERSINKIAEQLHVPVNLIQWKAYLDKAVQYLIHMNNPEKAQYECEQLQGSSSWYMQFLGGDFTGNVKTEISQLMDFVHKNKANITYYDIFRYCLEHNLLSVYNKYYFKLKDIYLE